MKNVFSHNAFNVLGLESNAPFKDIQRKAKEIIRNSEIDEDEVAGDFHLFDIKRDPLIIEESLSSLSSPKTKIFDYFFWFDASDKDDEKAITSIRAKEIEKAISIWSKKSKDSKIDSLFKKKNLAILMTSLVLGGQKDFLEESLINWKEILDSDAFFKAFEKVYRLNNDEDIDDSFFDSLSDQVREKLSDAYFDASVKDESVFAEFNNCFKAKGKNVKTKVVDPAINQLNLTIDALAVMNPSEDGVFSGDEAREVADCIKKIKEQLNKLVDYGLYEESETKVARDRAASEIRKVTLDIHNNLDETDKAFELLKIALAIVATSSVRRLIEDDIKTLKEVLKQKEIIAPIDLLFEEGRFEESIEEINKLKKQHNKNKEVAKYLGIRLKGALSLALASLGKAGWDDFNSKRWASAERNFLEIENVALKYDYLKVFDFDEEGLKNYLSGIETRVQLLKRDVSLVDTLLEDVRTASKEAFSDQWEGLVVISLAESLIMRRAIRYVRKANTANTLITIGNFTFFIYGIGIIFWILGWIYRKTS
jgi:hypothetical protein